MGTSELHISRNIAIMFNGVCEDQGEGVTNNISTLH